MNDFGLGPALLFCPADRPERYAKAAERADAVILDLEDAVAPGRKAAARDALVDTPIDPGRVVVRVNAAGTEDFAAAFERALASGKPAILHCFLDPRARSVGRDMADGQPL